ncbi:MAG: rhodanese-related sulfurtransferase [Pyrinomonadaceae bacterium]
MVQIITFYKFIRLDGLDDIRDRLKTAMLENSIKGTIIIANEGFNSTVCGEPECIELFLLEISKIFDCEFNHKSSFHSEMPFRKSEIKIKREIVTLKQDVDISLGEGTHVDASEWNRVISDPEVLVLDTRNYYEVKNGSFKNAVNPQTEKFSDLPSAVEMHFDPNKHKTIAMYCTGGIRCEKFAPYLKSKGFENVYQLRGGILKYLETVAPDESLWSGECFVFDDRRTLTESLEQGIQKDYSHPDNRDDPQ